MGCNPHSNPRDVGKFPKEMLDLKTGYTSFLKKKQSNTKNFRDNWKNNQRNAQCKSSFSTQNVSGLNHIFIQPDNNASCFLAGMQLVRRYQMA